MKTPKRETGRCIVVHRRLELPCFPAAEAGPAAIVSRGAMGAGDVGMLAKAIQSGSRGKEWAGAREGVERCVTVLSPSLPNLDFLGRLLDCELDWREWFGGVVDLEAADVVIVWQPSRLLPRMSLEAAASCLLEDALGGGAVYHASQLTELLDGSEVAS